MADAAQPALIWAENLKRWETTVQALMGASPPEHDETKALQDICSILTTLGANRDESHIFLPEAGGLDLHGARPGYEPDTIELIMEEGAVHILKPARLTFERLSGLSLAWCYFRLEAAPLEASGVYPGDVEVEEPLTELEPGRYASIEVWERRHFGRDEDGNDLPLGKRARPVHRCLRGVFVIFAKGSPYHQMPETYDGRHGRLGAAEFKAHVARLARQAQPA